MKNTTRPQYTGSQRGVVLLESLIAILIFSIGILGAVGLQATVIKNTSEAQYRAIASSYVQQRIGVIAVDAYALGAAGYGEVATNIAAISGLPNGARTTIRSDPADTQCALDVGCYSVQVTWNTPGADTHNVTTIARP